MTAISVIEDARIYVTDEGIKLRVNTKIDLTSIVDWILKLKSPKGAITTVPKGDITVQYGDPTKGEFLADGVTVGLSVLQYVSDITHQVKGYWEGFGYCTWADGKKHGVKFTFNVYDEWE